MIRKYPGPFVLLFVVAGILFADTFHLDSWLFLFLAVAAFGFGLLALVRHKATAASIALATSLGLIAGFNFSSSTYDTGPYSLATVVPEPRVYQLFGKVSDWPDLRTAYTEITIDLDSLRGTSSRKVNGTILLKVTDTTTALQRGDAVEFVGRIYPLVRGEDSRGSYRRRLSLRGISGVVYLPTLLDLRVDRRSSFGVIHVADRLRESIKESLRRNLSPESFALACGLLIGETRDIPPDLYTLFRDTGTLHLLAVSGSNVALLLIVAVSLLRPFRISRVSRSLVLMVIIFVFCLICYGEPSVIRASLMATLVILARLSGRRYDLNNIIGLTALVILAVAPSQLFDVGFQLSFATAWGLIFLVPRVISHFTSLSDTRWFKWALFPVIVSVVAQLVSAPIILYYFRTVPLVSPIANLVIVPMVSALVIGLQLILAAHLIWPTLGLLVGSLVDPLIRATIWVEKLFGEQHWRMLRLESQFRPVLEVLCTLGALATLVILILAITDKRFRRLGVIIMAVAIDVGLLSAITAAREGASISFASIPGGILGTIQRGVATPADCVVTGLTGKEYPVDERILAPILADRNITHVRRLVVLATSFDAVDELIRFSQRFHVDTVYLPVDLKPMVQDALSADTTTRDSSVSMRYYGALRELPSGNGFFVSKDCVVVCSNGSSYVFLTKLTHSDILPTAAGTSCALIIGNPWQASSDDWIKAHNCGYDLIVCSRIIQYRPANKDREDPDPDRVPPEYIYDLTRRGNLTLPLSPQSLSAITAPTASE